MKTLAAILIAGFLGIAAAYAHEQHENTPGPGLFGHQPEHLHVLLNPVPVYGMMIGVMALAGALIARSRAARVLALGIVIVAGASAWPTYNFGHSAYSPVREISDEQGKRWLDEHMNRAEKFMFLFYGTAVLGIAGLVTQKRFPKTATVVAVMTLIAAAASAGLGGWISRAGGHIRHSEFRQGSAPSSESHEHSSGQPSHEMTPHDKMPHTNAAESHQHDMEGKEAEKPAPEKASLPDTLEGVWQTIHEHHTQLETAVAARKFSDVQSHAQHLSELTRRLVELSHADHKSAVENGVNQINQALAEMRQSAETGSESVLKNNFDAFAKKLNELEPQMKKQ
jgi:hypothetical protein